MTTAAAAQSASGIAGVVRDASGGVLPGVTVEAASSALIEGTRTTVSDAGGQFQITDLRPGDYTVTFSLTGFKTVKREGIRLSAAFTATVNVELAVGQLEETITVSGESPLVDIRNSVSQSVMSREELDTIPTGKDPFAVGQLIPGITTNTPDVGGTQVMQQPTLQVHGSSNNDNVFMVDNVQIQHIGFGGNQTGFYFNDGLMDEISYQTSTLPAEAPVGGVQINMIPKDGGNQFHGGLFATGATRACRATTSTTTCARSASPPRTVSTASTTSTPPSAGRSSPTACGSSAPSAAGPPTTTSVTPSRRPASRRSTTSASPTPRCASPRR